MNMKKNLIYTLMFAGAVIMTACSKDELPDNIPDVSSSEIRFTGAIKKQSEILATTRAEPDPNNYVTLNETNENFGTFFIWLTVGEGDQSKNYFQKYEKADGEAGNLKVEGSDNNEERLNWVNKTSKHTFYAWTEPHVLDNTSQITGGVQMDHKNIEPSGNLITGETIDIDDIAGTVIYGTNKETNLEKFIVTKKGPLTYNDWGQDVALYFERPIAKIELVGITHIKEGGEEDVIGGQDNFTCTINFPNMYKEATFTPANFEYDKQSPLSTDKQDKGLVWNYSYSDKSSGSVLYVHPFKFRDGSNSDNIYDDPGYFIVTATFNNVEMHYAGTLGELSLYTQLNAGEHMKLWLYLRDARGTGGVGYEIKDWGTDPEQTLPQYRIPGVYNKDDADRLLDALQKAADNPDYTFPEGVEDLIVNKGDDTTPQYEINLFTHIDWSSIEDEITEIKIPDGYTLKGNGYNVTLKNGVNITGKQVENIYVNNRVPGVYSEAEAGRLLTALTTTDDESKKFPNGVKDLLVGSTINLFCNIDWSNEQISGQITIPDGYSLNGNGYNITLPNDVSITGNDNIKNLYVNGGLYSNENGESDTDEPSGSDAIGDPTT